MGEERMQGDGGKKRGPALRWYGAQNGSGPDRPQNVVLLDTVLRACGNCVRLKVPSKLIK